ncbi:MAG TPA: hypothetical protein VGT24_11980 [Candidatus Acidoferrales bacterium]|nr:hypothetical protein [Candidatus Acidoferrales bacterium]
MKRPAGVTILCAVMILAGLGFAAAGFAFYFMGSTGATATAAQNSVMAIVLAGLGAAAGVIFLLFGAVHVLLAVGIFKLLNVARVFTIFLFVLIAGGASLGLIATLLSYSRVGLAWNACILAVDLLGLWYLLRRETKKAFHT